MPRPKSQLNEVMTFGEHLEALRWHLVRAVVGVAICLVGCLIVGESLLRFLLGPAQRALAKHNAGAIVVNNFMDGLVAFFQISMVGGLLLASPWVIYQLWGFLSPGLYPRERRLVFRSVPFLVVLFLAGSLFGWFVALPNSLDFMVRFNQGRGSNIRSRLPVGRRLRWSSQWHSASRSSCRSGWWCFRRSAWSAWRGSERSDGTRSSWRRWLVPC